MTSAAALGGRFVLGERLGAGAMGAVHVAQDLATGGRVAVKILHPHLASDRELVSRFEREALAVAALGHPNIVRPLAFAYTEDHRPYLAMELLDGRSLGDVLRERSGEPLPEARVVGITLQVLAALEAAHAAGIVHRDIKPDNLFLAQRPDGTDLVKVLDFGTAKLLSAREDMALTREGVLLGTLTYMPPEQARGEEVDARADLYALGACTYVALTGRKPFEAPNLPALLLAIQHRPPTPITTLRPEVRPDVAAVIERALAKRRDDRFPSARAMADALRALGADVQR